MDALTLSIVSHGHGSMLAQLLDDLAVLKGSSDYKIILTLNVPGEKFDLAAWPQLNILLLHNKIPQGFGANHNAAFNYCSSPWFVVLNPDLRLPENPFPGLLKRAASIPTLGAIAPCIVDSSGGREDSLRTNLTPWSLVRRAFSPRAGCADVASLDTQDGFYWLAGMFLVFSSGAFRAVGGFDKRFFLYCEDYDICARLRRAGYKLAVESKSVSVHNAQRDSRRSIRHLRWHLSSLLKVWTSSAFWWATFARKASFIDGPTH